MAETTTTNSDILTAEQVQEIRNRMINGTEYEKLADEEKTYYREIICDDSAFLSFIELVGKFGALGSLLAPAYTLFARLPSPNILTLISQILNPVITLLKMISEIKSLEDLPVIGYVFKMIYALFKLLVQVIGSLLMTVLLVVFSVVSGVFDNTLDGLDNAWEYMKDTFGWNKPKNVEKVPFEMDYDMLNLYFKADKNVAKIVSEILKPLNQIIEIAKLCTKLKNEWRFFTRQGISDTTDFVFKILCGMTVKEILDTLFMSKPIPPMKDIYNSLLEMNKKLEELNSSTYIRESDYALYMKHLEAKKNKKKTGITDTLSAEWNKSVKKVKDDYKNFQMNEKKTADAKIKEYEESLAKKNQETEAAKQNAINTITTALTGSYVPK